jgi:hypothetical protein
MTFIEAAITILKKFNNKSLSSSEIWSKIEEENLVKSDGKTPWATLNTILLTNSNNSNIKIRSKTPILTIEENSKPQKFSLLLDEIEKNTIQIFDEVDEKIENTLLCEITDESLGWKKLKLSNNDENIVYEITDCEEYTYIIEDKLRETIKIGKTKNDPFLRVNQLKTGNPSINLLLVFPSTFYSEDELHKEYDDYRKDLEWFFFTKKLKIFVNNEITKKNLILETYSKKLQLIEFENKMIDILK